MDVVRVSTRGDYACRALLSLALHADSDGPTSVRDIAERTGLPQPYLEQILLALKGAGLVRSKRGVGGGYVLARDPAEIRLSEIVSAVDGPITLGDFGQPHQDGACDHEGQCVLIAVWNEAGEYMRHHLDSYTLADDRRRSPRATPRGRRRPPSGAGRPDPSALVATADVAAVSRLGCELGEERGQVGRQRAGERQPLAPSTGWSNDSSAAWRNGRVSAERRAPLAVGRVADERVADGGEVDADLVGAPGLQPARQPGQRRPGRRAGRRTWYSVRAGLPSTTTAILSGSAGSRPIGASMMPCGASGWPHTTAS